ncbi:ATP-binding cassette domain-containing protein [Celerinatantimonas sp. MCCC 1A17872]|uniref:ATP-binding cassette domain-containing protein n=1 Tax=Celerinatantimonas sp. MCCC 1A17872 TaxID=3177514 RepID=UPI0038CB5D74
MSQIQISNFALAEKFKTLVELTIGGGQLVACYGDIGSGSEEMLKVLFGEKSPLQGKVRYNGEPIPQQANALEQWRHKGVMLISWRLPLLEWLSVNDNLLFVLQVRGYSVRKAQERIQQALEEDNLLEHLDKTPQQLNHAQHIQLLLWRAYLCQPELLLIDSLLNELPKPLQEKWHSRLHQLCQSRQSIVVIHTTHLASLCHQADYLLLFEKGNCTTHGTPAKLLVEDNLPALRKLVANINPLQALTAGQLAKWPTLTLDIHTLPDSALKAMQQARSSYAYLLDGKKLVGGLSLYQVNRALQQKSAQLNEFLDLLPTITDERPFSEVIAEGPAKQRDLAVIDAKGKYLGQLRHKQVLASLHDLLNNAMNEAPQS